MRIELGDIAVYDRGNHGEERAIRANLVIDGRVVRQFGESYFLDYDQLLRHGAPEKLRHNVDNGLRNRVTRAIIEYQYGE